MSYRPLGDASNLLALALLAHRQKIRPSFGFSTQIQDGCEYRIKYCGDLTWDVYANSRYVGAIVNEDSTHYSYILPGHAPITGPETSLNWRTALRSLTRA